MAAGALPHVGSGAPFPCPFNASHVDRRPKQSGLAPAAAWPSRKSPGCLCWTNAYRQVFDALSVSKVLWRSQRSDSLTSDEVRAASRQRRLSLCQRPEGSPPLRVGCQCCGSSTSPLVHLKPGPFKLERGKIRATKVLGYVTSTFIPARVVKKMRRDASDRRCNGRARCAKNREYSGTAHIFFTEAAPFPKALIIAAETAQVTQRYVHLLAEFIRRMANAMCSLCNL